MEQEARAPLEYELQIALRQMPQEGEGMQCTFEERRIYSPEIPPLIFQPGGREAYFSPLTPLYSNMSN